MARPRTKPPIKIHTPSWLWQEWLITYGGQTADKIARAHLEEAPLDLSFHHRPPNLEGELLGLQTLRLKKKTKIESLDGFNEKDDEAKFWVQDIAASLAAHLFGDIKGRAVLEYGAAPGGKSAQLISLGAKITALELSPERAKRWHDNMARLNFKGELIITDGKTYQAKKPFDSILLDAPCSSTGTGRRHPELIWIKTQKQIANLQKEQLALLKGATRNLAPGGLLIYVVCSLQQSEGLDIINHYLKKYPYMRNKPIQASEIGSMTHLLTDEGFVRSLPFHQPNLLKQKERNESGATPLGGMDGFFIARLERTQ
jgi:16S rRNA (cytosine967-C5)-methyltransferase